jgi:hypothetical protein
MLQFNNKNANVVRSHHVKKLQSTVMLNDQHHGKPTPNVKPLKGTVLKPSAFPSFFPVNSLSAVFVHFSKFVFLIKFRSKPCSRCAASRTTFSLSNLLKNPMNFDTSLARNGSKKYELTNQKRKNHGKRKQHHR